MRRRTVQQEPCTINADVVCDFLESCQCPGMAEFVRHLGRHARDANAREQQLRDQHEATLRRLDQYEPRDQHVPWQDSGCSFTGD